MLEEKLLKIIRKYGLIHQLRKLQEEVFELNEAIIREDEAEINYYEGRVYASDLENHIAEEIADVLVMLCQFKEYYHIDGNDILRIMNEKVDRQLDRIANETK